MLARVPVWAQRTVFVVLGLFGLLLMVDLASTLVARHRKPERLHRAFRKLGKQMNRIYLWAIDRFDLDRNSEQVVVFHKGRRSGNEYATPLCVSHCDEGFIVGD